MSITTPPKDYRKLFIDMNAFFASVEQQIQPPLRGQPIGVTPFTGNSGCILARSCEAKDWGVKTGDRVGDAKVKCPKLQVIETKPAIYLFYHKEILEVLKNHSPYVTPVSIDEFVIQLTGSDQSEHKATLMANSIKKTINEKVGDYLKCSIGVGPSTFLSKVACEFKKPDGFTLIKLSELNSFYRQLSLRDLPGINFQMEVRLNRMNVKTPSDLFALPINHWQKSLGHLGKTWHYRLRGYEIDVKPSDVKTIGHSHVLAPEFRNQKGAFAVIKKLVQKVGRRLREKNLLAGGVYLHISFYDHLSFHQGKKTPDFTDDHTLSQHIFSLLQGFRFTKKPLKVAISVFNLTSASAYQLSIFPDIEKKRSLSKAMDQINDRFGASTIHPTSADSAKNAAPDRIPFGQPSYDILNS